jgi:K+-sensing histidine kinase KdpD
MLTDGVVLTEEKRREYLKTLSSEANRLGHLVENVLSYAQLERGNSRGKIEKLTLRTLVDRVLNHLSQRTEQAGMKLEVVGEEQAFQKEVQVDVAVIERILFNLVDNACKYAGPVSAQKSIQLEATFNDSFGMLRVRDFGRGISPEKKGQLFKPFCKSAHEAAHSAPGIGLGLALCRRLSRAIGGDLVLDSTISNGASFVLSLPSGAPKPVL